MDEQYSLALAALRFFSLSADAQLKSADENRESQIPNFFPEKTKSDEDSNFYFGVACVFITYCGALYDRFISEDDVSELNDFAHRLKVAMQDQNSSTWSKHAVLSSDMWQALREDASEALKEIGEDSPFVIPKFNISELVNESEFITSDEARNLL